MKNIKNIIGTTLLIGLLIPSAFVGAQTPVAGSSGHSGSPLPVTEHTGSPSNKTSTLQNPIKVKTVGEAIDTGMTIFTYFAVIIAVVCLIIVGLQFILAQGKSEEITKAGLRLWYIVIGIAIILGARLTVSIVLNTLKAAGVLTEQTSTNAQNALRGSNLRLQ